jgi:hypothetical protein
MSYDNTIIDSKIQNNIAIADVIVPEESFIFL